MKAVKHDVKVGDMYAYSWGYEQTQVEFWQVTKLVGKTMVELRRVQCELAPAAGCSSMSGYSRPVRNGFLASYPEPIRKRVQTHNGEPCLSMDFGYLRPTTTDEAHYVSWYG